MDDLSTALGGMLERDCAALPPRACLSFLGGMALDGQACKRVAPRAQPAPRAFSLPYAPCRARAGVPCCCLRAPRRRICAQRTPAPCWRARARGARGASIAAPPDAHPARARRHAARAAADRARAYQAAAVHRAAPGGRAGGGLGARRAARRRPRAGAQCPSVFVKARSSLNEHSMACMRMTVLACAMRRAVRC